MTDFVAILHRTIGGLSDNSPEMREKVFDKARATIQAKLAALDPQPPKAVVDRQMQSLEDAISAVRSEYEPEVDEIDTMFAEETFELEQELEAEVAAADEDTAADGPVLPAAGELDYEHSHEGYEDEPVVVARRHHDEDDPVLAAHREEPPYREARPPRAAKAGGSRRFGMAAVAAAVVLVIAAGAAAWFYQDRIGALVGSDPVAQAPAGGGGGTQIVLAGDEDEPETEAAEAPEEVARASEPEAEPAAAEEEEKFTQRLLPDGSEVDEGPAGGEAGIGEGTSVATASGAEGEQTAQAGTADGETPAAGGDQVAVGQRAIFYEERTASAEGSAEPGSTVWSIVQESPGGNAPPEPAIRGETSIPGSSVQLRITIRRNADSTLPASHIIEMIFLTPDNFAGGAVDNVLRVAMKDTEEATGSALMGIPAKIADGFFLIALSDSPAEIEANLNLMRRQSWIDIPVIYRSGRRALMTMEKGVPGERVFQEAIQAWEAASSG